MQKIISSLLQKYNCKKINKTEILKDLFENEFLRKTIVSEIRRNTIIGIIAKEVFEKLGSKETCKIMAIGDIEYTGVLKKKWCHLIENSLKNINSKYLSGYDLNGVGSEELHKNLLNYMDNYYNLGILKSEIKKTIIPCYGATDGFNMILDSLNQIYSGKNIDFIFPEASFSANIEVAKSFKFNILPLNKPEKDNFFISKKQIDNIYKKREDKKIFYFTSIGNPSGEKINKNDFFEIINYIFTLDKTAIFILDNVYVGLLKNKESENLFKKIFKKRELLERIIFCESLSKTLGLTGIRVAWSWSLNEKINSNIKKTTTLKKAGYSKVLDSLSVNLLSQSEKIVDFSNEVYKKISENRLKFYENMKKNYAKFFDFEASPKISERQGLYVLLKVKNGIKICDIFAETGIIGVGMNFSDGEYIRYSFGEVF